MFAVMRWCLIGTSHEFRIPHSRTTYVFASVTMHLCLQPYECAVPLICGSFTIIHSEPGPLLPNSTRPHFSALLHTVLNVNTLSWVPIKIICWATRLRAGYLVPVCLWTSLMASTRFISELYLGDCVSAIHFIL
jgi:hypothetical protein